MGREEGGLASGLSVTRELRIMVNSNQSFILTVYNVPVLHHLSVLLYWWVKLEWIAWLCCFRESTVFKVWGCFQSLLGKPSDLRSCHEEWHKESYLGFLLKEVFSCFIYATLYKDMENEGHRKKNVCLDIQDLRGVRKDSSWWGSEICGWRMLL